MADLDIYGSVTDVLERQREKGVHKYGLDINRKDRASEHWVDEAIAEAVDLAVYLTRIREDIKMMGQYKTDTDRVTEFHDAFVLPVKQDLDYKQLVLRKALIDEEYDEVAEAFQVHLATKDAVGIWPNDEYMQGKFKLTSTKLLKELVDLKYVIDGMAVALGWDIDVAYRRVHESNMSKLDADGKPLLRADGKVLKSSLYKEPYLGDLV
jgi:predicted HAD superfamily Cof-like phosphohydrolase